MATTMMNTNGVGDGQDNYNENGVDRQQQQWMATSMAMTCEHHCND